MDSESHLFWYAQLVVPITVARRDRSPVTANQSQATKQTASTDCHAVTSITLDTEQVSPRVVSVLVAAIEVDCSWFMSLLSLSPF